MASPDEDGFIECTKCERKLPGTKEYFFEQRGSYYPRCKECKGSEFGIQKPNYALDSKEGHKFCARCMKELPATREYFYTDKTSGDELTVACKKCWNGADYGIHKPNSNRDDGMWLCTGCGVEYERTEENFYTQGDRLSPHCKECHVNKRNDARREKRYGTDASISGNKWESIKQEFDHECAYCGDGEELTRDHVVPVSKGGNGTVVNVVPACSRCNTKKSNKRVSEWYPKQEFYEKQRMDRILNAPLSAYNE